MAIDYRAEVWLWRKAIKKEFILYLTDSLERSRSIESPVRSISPRDHCLLQTRSLRAAPGNNCTSTAQVCSMLSIKCALISPLTFCRFKHCSRNNVVFPFLTIIHQNTVNRSSAFCGKGDFCAIVSLSQQT